MDLPNYTYIEQVQKEDLFFFFFFWYALQSHESPNGCFYIFMAKKKVALTK